MKKKIFTTAIFIVLLIILLFISITIFQDKSIHISKEMKEEEGTIESAWDFQENLKIGWNLGMSLSANIPYPKIIKYKLIIEDNDNNCEESELFICEEKNKYYSNIKSLRNLKIEFDIPYTNLDGTLSWEITELLINNKNVDINKQYVSRVEKGKLIVTLDTINISYINQIDINIKINKFYEDNTLDKVDFYETFWCPDKTTKELLLTLKNAGFNAIRISFDVYNHIDEFGIIDNLWLNRLKEIVDYCIELDIYCLIDIIETYGLYVDDLNEKSINLYISLLKQVTSMFKDYNEKLLFSPFNEIRNSKGDWNTNNIEELNNINYLYQIFVDTIRSTGGNNKERNLILTTYAAGISNEILNHFKIPNDTTKNHLLIECHNYQPVRFTFNEINLGNTDFLTEWGSYKDKQEMKKTFKTLNKFIKKTQVPLIIGEFGVVDRIEINERIDYLQHYVKNAKKYNIGLFIFDDSYDFAIINRKTNQFINQEIIDILTNN